MERISGASASPRHTDTRTPRYRRFLRGLLALNAVDVLLVTLLCFWQGRQEFNRRKADSENSFLSMVESFSIFAGGNMLSQQMAVLNWTRYIEHEDMDVDGAMVFLAGVSEASGFHLHLVQANTLKGYCASLPPTIQADMPATVDGHPALVTRPYYQPVDYRAVASSFASVMPNMLAALAGDETVYLIPLFTSDGTAEKRLAFCAPALLRDGEEHVRYIVMKIVSAEELGQMWRIPDRYRMAEVALLDKYGDYILKGQGFTGNNFWNHLRSESGLSYFDIGRLQGDFQRGGASLAELSDQAGNPVYYAGCPSDRSRNQFFVLRIRRDEIMKESVSYRLAVTVLLGMLGLFMVDGAYLLITNRRLKESAARAEQESRFKTEFLSSMSHDIRTPMNAIMGLTKIMRHSWGDEEKMRECLTKVEISGRHLLMLINDVLDISKIESDGVVLSPVPFSVSSILNEIRTLTEAQSRDKGLAVSFRLEGVERDLLVADELRLKQVFMNLLSNAIKYTPEGGHVDVLLSESIVSRPEAGRSQGGHAGLGGQSQDGTGGLGGGQGIGGQGGNGNADGSGKADSSGKADGVPGGRQIMDSLLAEHCKIRYVVRDTGLGMSEDFMKTMYQAFTREVDTRVNKIPGTGLGLAIVKQLVDLMGGTIDCQSIVNKGTTFTVELELPVAQGKDRQAGAEEVGNMDFLKGARLLVAEDNDINWEIEKELLSYRGILCDRAENGKVCVNMLADAPAGTYAAILMDMQMPVMDGLEAARAIRALSDPAKNGIPIVAVTANAFVDDVRTCMDAGMDAHVCKPLNVDNVVKALGAVIRRRS